MRLRRLVLVAGPNVHIVCIAFWSQQFSIHRGWTNYSDFSWMAYDLFDFDVWMLFGCIKIKYRFQFWNQVMILLWYFYVCQYDIIWAVGPSAVCWVVESICLAGKVNSLIYHLRVLIHQRTPLNWCRRPVQKVFVDKVIKWLMILPP